MEARITSWNETTFGASAFMQFTLPIGVELPGATMRQAVLNADRLNLPLRKRCARPQHQLVQRAYAEDGG
jgi:hypothetical protein